MVGGHQVGRPKPRAQRRARSVHHGARRHRRLLPAACAHPQVPARLATRPTATTALGKTTPSGQSDANRNSRQASSVPKRSWNSKIVRGYAGRATPAKLVTHRMEPTGYASGRKRWQGHAPGDRAHVHHAPPRPAQRVRQRERRDEHHLDLVAHVVHWKVLSGPGHDRPALLTRPASSSPTRWGRAATASRSVTSSSKGSMWSGASARTPSASASRRTPARTRKPRCASSAAHARPPRCCRGAHEHTLGPRPSPLKAAKPATGNRRAASRPRS